MTGFGSARGETDGEAFAVEVRTVNHRFCEVKPRLPRELVGVEVPLVAQVKARITRGVVEVTVRRQAATGTRVAVDLDLARAYAERIRAVGEAIGDDGRLRDLVCGLPGVLSVDEAPAPDPEALWPQLQPIVERALAGVLEMREREGTAIAQDLAARLEGISRYLAAIRAAVPEALERHRARLVERIGRLLEEVEVELDPGRIATEVAILAERTDVSEELARLESHLAQFDSLLERGGVVGRKLDFLVQEMNREVNTLGAKSQEGAITRAVVDVKAELERIREQVQNLE